MSNVMPLHPAEAEKQPNGEEYALFQSAARVAAILPDNGRDALRVLELARKWLEEYLRDG